MRPLLEKLARVVGLLSLLTLLGTLGYRVVEEWSWGDALHVAVITLATVGFDEPRPRESRRR